MKNIMRDTIKTAGLAFIASSTFFFTGCNSTGSVANLESVKMPPAMNYTLGGHRTASTTTDTYDQHTAPTTSVVLSQAYNPGNSSRQVISRSDIMRELRGKGVVARPTVNDFKYVIPDHNWIATNYRDYFTWYLNFLSARYKAEGMDCDNFANFYQQNMVLANLKAGGTRQGDVPCATIVVNQYDRGIYHALNLVRTDRGWFVVEPQDGQITALNDYRYRNEITKITF